MYKPRQKINHYNYVQSLAEIFPNHNQPGPEGGADSGAQERGVHPAAGEQPPQTVGGPHLGQQRLLRAGVGGAERGEPAGGGGIRTLRGRSR